MRLSPTRENEWGPMFGIFRVPQGSGTIRFFLNQAERRDMPQNGSAARFDDLGLYLFATEEDARAFAIRNELPQLGLAVVRFQSTARLGAQREQLIPIFVSSFQFT
jgi:hypothetical protein